MKAEIRRLIRFGVLIVMMLVPPLHAQAADESTANEENNTKTLVWPDGTRYVGGVKDGKRSGKGTIFWQDGTRFVGTFENDMRNGPGTMILPDDTVYNGYFENDTLVDAPATIAGKIQDQPVEIAQAEPSAAARPP